MNVPAFPPNKRRNLQSSCKANVHQLYSSDDVIKLFGISRNTLTNWIADGLLFIAAGIRLFRGKELNAFHARRKERASGTPPGPFMVKCFGCKGYHSLIAAEVVFAPGRTPEVFRARINCPETGVGVNRYVCREDIETIRSLLDSNPGSQTRD